MPRKQKKYHVIYKTTCKVNNKFYVGMHSTDNLDDGYLGSGKYLWNSIRKHGKDNFNVEFLEFFDNRKDLINREIEMVNEDLIQDPMCMNLMTGGKGGFISTEQQRNRSIAGGKAFANKLKTDDKFRAEHRKRAIQKLDQARLDGKIKYDNFKGKTHSKETKNKMRESHVGLHDGEKNSQFGTGWIYKPGIKKYTNKKIKKVDLDLWLSKGWLKGRKISPMSDGS